MNTNTMGKMEAPGSYGTHNTYLNTFVKSQVQVCHGSPKKNLFATCLELNLQLGFKAQGYIEDLVEILHIYSDSARLVGVMTKMQQVVHNLPFLYF